MAERSGGRRTTQGDHTVDSPPAHWTRVTGMAWATPDHGRTEVDRTGRRLIGPISGGQPITDQQWPEIAHALDVVNNWRAAHGFPLNAFQILLRRKTKRVQPQGGLIAQRLKRLWAITQKLQRFPSIRLSQMQDIGGCRSVVENVSRVRQLVELYAGGGIKHELVRQDDYISAPQVTGYRSYHLVHRFHTDSKVGEVWNTLKIETQIRSAAQHAWATAVETVDTFTRQALKSSRGQAEWLRFFALMGTALANKERTTPVPNTPANPAELARELREHEGALDVIRHLTAYGTAVQTTLAHPHARSDRYFLLELNAAAKQVKVTGFTATNLREAEESYLFAERGIMHDQAREAVLVSVRSLKALRRAYPNYFLDTTRFVKHVEEAIR